MRLSLAPSTYVRHAPSSPTWARVSWVQRVVRVLLGSRRFPQEESGDPHLELKEAEQSVNSLFQVENWGEWLSLRTTSFENRINRAYSAKYQLDRSIRYLDYRASCYNALYRLERQLRDEHSTTHIDASTAHGIEQAIANIRAVRDGYTTLHVTSY